MKRFFVIAAVATFATAAQAAEQPASSTTTAAATSSVSTSATAPAQGQSSTSAATAAAPAKKWSGSFVSEVSVTAPEMNYTNDTDKTVNTTNLVSIGYKVAEKTKIGARQYFSYNHDSQAKQDKTKFDTMFAALTLTQGFDGILKSDPISATFWYYLPTTPADYDARSNGNFRMDAEVAWTLTPKWTASYYFNPRQNMIPYSKTYNEEGKEKEVFTRTTLIHYGVLYYNVSDTQSYYTYAGFMHRWRSYNMKIVEDHFLAAVGAQYAFFGGKLSLVPEIGIDNTLPRNGKNTQVATTYNEENLTYTLQAAVAF